MRTAGFPVDGPRRLADEPLARAADALIEAPPAGGDQRARFADQWLRHAEARAAQVAAIATDPTFRLALTWQNRKVLDNAVRPFLAQVARGEPRSRKLRVREQVIVAYWQRYSLKCESIGFFGPTTWASVGGPGPVIATSPGPSLVDHTAVLFEAWPIDGLARALEREHDLRSWLAPRRAPHIAATDGMVLLPDGGRAAIDPLTQSILTAADGRTPAVDLAVRIAAQHPATSCEQVLRALDDLRRKGWLIWKFELSPTVRPEAELRAFLDRVGSPARAWGLARLDDLERARDAVAEAVMDLERLEPALAALDEAFVDATDAATTRYDGLAYGGRTLAYPECRRDLTVHLGQSLVEAMAPLALVLDSIRWMLHRVGEAVLELVRGVYDDLVARGNHEPSASMLWLACTPILGGQIAVVVEKTLAELQRRWRSVLDIPDGAATATFRLEDIRGAAADAFASPPPDWAEARWCCPDVMLAAESEDAIRAGEFHVVLGEVHAAVNTVDYCSMVPLHRRPQELMACLDADHPGPRLTVALPRESRPRLTVRAHPTLIRDFDHRLVVLPHIPIPQRGRVHLGADVPVVSEGKELSLVLPDGTRFGVLALFTNAMRAEVAQAFDLYPAGDRPRIVVDRMVLARQRWSLRAAEMSFAELPDEADRFVACRAWMREHGLPRDVFVKSPLETKPFYVDFAGPPLVELLVTAARQANRAGPDVHLGITEMLPGTDEAWLTDADGRRYAAELRFVAFDSRPTDRD